MYNERSYKTGESTARQGFQGFSQGIMNTSQIDKALINQGVNYKRGLYANHLINIYTFYWIRLKIERMFKDKYKKRHLKTMLFYRYFK